MKTGTRQMNMFIIKKQQGKKMKIQDKIMKQKEKNKKKLDKVKK